MTSCAMALKIAVSMTPGICVELAVEFLGPP